MPIIKPAGLTAKTDDDDEPMLQRNLAYSAATHKLDYENFSDFLCGGCVATSKAIKTAPQNQSLTIAKLSRSPCRHVRCQQQQRQRHCCCCLSNEILTSSNTNNNNKRRRSSRSSKIHCCHRIFILIIIIMSTAGRRNDVWAAPLMKAAPSPIDASATATATTSATVATAIAKATVVRTVSSLVVASDDNSSSNNSSTPATFVDKSSFGNSPQTAGSGSSSSNHHQNHHSNNHHSHNSSSSSGGNKSRPRKRHSKRHSNWYDYVDYNENSTILEWANPCGGYYDPTQMGGAEGYAGVRRMRNKEIFNILKRSVGNEFKTLNGSQQDIDLSNIKLWSLYEYTYKFLPKLKMNSSIALRRWYRNTQTYVASFAYLRRIQLKWDYNKRQRESRVANELKHLLLSSRSMLCELETAINSTQPHRRDLYHTQQQQQQQQQQPPRLYIFSRQQMSKRLKLRTKRRSERSPDALHEADSIDLQYVKLYYYEFLETMWKLLRKNMKRRGQIALRGNRKEFNEVSKQFGSLAAGHGRRRGADLVPQRGGKQRQQRRRRQQQRRNRSLPKPYIERYANTAAAADLR